MFLFLRMQKYEFFAYEGYIFGLFFGVSNFMFCVLKSIFLRNLQNYSEKNALVMPKKAPKILFMNIKILKNKIFSH